MSIRQKDEFKIERFTLNEAFAVRDAYKEMRKQIVAEQKNGTIIANAIGHVINVYNHAVVIGAVASAFFTKRSKTSAGGGLTLLAIGNAAALLISDLLYINSNKISTLTFIDHGIDGLDDFITRMRANGFEEVEAENPYKYYYDGPTGQEVMSIIQGEPYIRAFWKNGNKYTLEQ
ncbi:hypothetical protein [Ureibacillus acetophenoni]|uniref:Uncharacterized protein n=1 Tax=Ureibacillus acetophenoni TaxID=614649 RepID=A0A285US33_9BACL|nr:hypothetical protein [Ureibacillus acetophenoni]SOC44632.1 hypothetical protein SAMN05877842_12224 [Ureibacillus acetophenoni]